MPPPDGFADPWALTASAAGGALPPTRITVADWATNNRYVGGARAGMWNHDTGPYLVEPMLALTDDDVSDVIVPGPGQCGKTLIAENWLGQSIETDPADFGWYLNTDDVLRAYVKDRINIGLIETHAKLLKRLGRGDTDNSLSFKRFEGMVAHFLPATSSALVNKTFQRIVADEWDNYSPEFGDPKTQFDVRRQTYGRAGKMLAISHPDLAQGLSPSGWKAGIMALYARSTRCTWWWRCPHCNRTSSPNPGTARQMVLDYPVEAPLDVIAAEARLLCPYDDCPNPRIEDHQRSAMNRTGVWIGQGQEIEPDGTITSTRTPNSIAGYWIVGLMSSFLADGIGGLARSYAAAVRDVIAAEAGADKTLREVMSKKLGIPFTPPKEIQAVDADTVAARATDALQLGHVPAGVRYLITTFDVQGNRFERLTRGFGPGMESWVIKHSKITAEPATSSEDWNDIITTLLAETFPLADGSGRVMKVRAVGFDSSGLPGVTENAYAAWKRARLARLAQRYGRSAGRDQWNLLPLKGAGTANAQRLIVALPDSMRKDRHAGARGEVPLGVFNANQWKDALSGQLARSDPGPPTVHFPAGLLDPSGKGPHEFFEQLFAETRSTAGVWTKTGPRNEVLDLMVMCHIMAHLHASRIDWRIPPAWAAEWDRNSLVGPPPSLGETVVNAMRAVAAAVGQAPAAPVQMHPGAINQASQARMRAMAARLP